MTATYKDGRTVPGREVSAIDFDGKETKAMRYYVVDPATLGVNVGPRPRLCSEPSSGAPGARAL